MCKHRQPNSWKKIYYLCTKYGKRCPGMSWVRCPERLPVTLAVVIAVLMAAAMAWGEMTMDRTVAAVLLAIIVCGLVIVIGWGVSDALLWLGK